MRARSGLVLSVVAVVAYWIVFATSRLLRDPATALPTSILALFLRKLVEAGTLAVVVGVLLARSRETWDDLGVSGRHLARSVLEGLAWGAVLFVVVNVGVNSLVSSLLGGAADSATRALFRDPAQAPWWVLTAIVGGGFAEELTRAFALTRFDRLFGRVGLVVALVLDSIVFGIGHLYQGRAGAVSAGITGFLFALIFLRRRRATDAMAAHAAFDLYGIAAAYALYGGRA